LEKTHINKNKKKRKRSRRRGKENRGEGKSRNLSLRHLKQQHRCLELPSVSHDTATGLHHRTASEVAGPARHRLLRARYLFVPLHFYLVLWHKFLLHAESFCMQEDGWGKITPPFCFLGQASSSPTLMSGPSPAQTRRS